jgi:hypothetical protein
VAETDPLLTGRTATGRHDAPLLILADDVTGAADSAARAHAAGLPTTIVLAGRIPLGGAAALTSDSRHLLVESAAARVAETVLSAAAPPAAVWYKKID